MDSETMVLLTGLIGTVMVTGLLGAAIVGAYFFGRSRGERSGGTPAEGPNADRMARVERLLEGLVLEVERLGEAQRYAARTLRGASEEQNPGARHDAHLETMKRENT